MSTQTKGKCKYCGKEYGKGYMLRHLKSCEERAAVIDSKSGKSKCGYFELVISGKYDNRYWLIVEIWENATLKELDQFIRNIWVECCGHLSAFDIYGQSYESNPDTNSFWGEPSENMNHKLAEIFQEGMSIGYEYDFGSTTELLIEVKGYRTGIRKREDLEVISRNNPIEWMCDVCKKQPAVYIDVERYYEEGIGLLCEECSDEPENESDFLSSVCNSPRMGVCGYDGSEAYPDQFVPDKKIK